MRILIRRTRLEDEVLLNIPVCHTFKNNKETNECSGCTTVTKPDTLILAKIPYGPYVPECKKCIHPCEHTVKLGTNKTWCGCLECEK